MATPIFLALERYIYTIFIMENPAYQINTSIYYGAVVAVIVW